MARNTSRIIPPRVDEGPALARPRRVQNRPSIFGVIRASADNNLELWDDEAYELDWMERHMVFRHVVVANSPPAARHVLLENHSNYEKTPIARNLLEPGLGRGLITTEGAQWKRQRRIMAPAFSAKNLEPFGKLIVAETNKLADQWRAGTTLDLVTEIVRLTLTVVSKIMFSLDSSEELMTIGEGFSKYQHVVHPGIADLLGLPQWIPRPAIWRGRMAVRTFDPFISRLIASRHGQLGQRHDLLTLLMAARDHETGQGMSDAEIRAQVATIFTAGHETTAMGLVWTFYLLGMHSWADQKLQSELDAVLHGELPDAGDVPGLAYTRQVFDEAMRLYPPVHTIARRAIAADVVAGHEIRAGSDVIVSPWLLHRHRKLWSEPDRFDPERFAPRTIDQRDRFSYIPFGAGPRICIGQSFAMMEGVLMLATLAQRWRFEVLQPEEIEPVGLITLRPRGGLRAKVHPR
jgi:cytochrome P450